MNPVERRNQWREKIERCLSSGLPVYEWCRLNKIAPSTLYSWMAKFRKEETESICEPNASEWIEVTKRSLAANAALAPKVTGGSAPREKSHTGNLASAPLAIGARINGVDLSIPSGCSEADVIAVFKAASSL